MVFWETGCWGEVVAYKRWWQPEVWLLYHPLIESDLSDLTLNMHRKSVTLGLQVLDLCRCRDSWCWPKGEQPLGMKMHYYMLVYWALVNTYMYVWHTKQEATFFSKHKREQWRYSVTCSSITGRFRVFVYNLARLFCFVNCRENEYLEWKGIKLVMSVTRMQC